MRRVKAPAQVKVQTFESMRFSIVTVMQSKVNKRSRDRTLVYRLHGQPQNKQSEKDNHSMWRGHGILRAETPKEKRKEALPESYTINVHLPPCNVLLNSYAKLSVHPGEGARMVKRTRCRKRF